MLGNEVMLVGHALLCLCGNGSYQNNKLVTTKDNGVYISEVSSANRRSSKKSPKDTETTKETKATDSVGEVFHIAKNKVVTTSLLYKPSEEPDLWDIFNVLDCATFSMAIDNEAKTRRLQKNCYFIVLVNKNRNSYSVRVAVESSGIPGKFSVYTMKLLFEACPFLFFDVQSKQHCIYGQEKSSALFERFKVMLVTSPVLPKPETTETQPNEVKTLGTEDIVEIVEQKKLLSNVTLSNSTKNWTSLVDLTGNMLPEVVLDTFYEGNRKLLIYPLGLLDPSDKPKEAEPLVTLVIPPGEEVVTVQYIPNIAFPFYYDIVMICNKGSGCLYRVFTNQDLKPKEEFMDRTKAVITFTGIEREGVLKFTDHTIQLSFDKRCTQMYYADLCANGQFMFLFTFDDGRAFDVYVQKPRGEEKETPLFEFAQEHELLGIYSLVKTSLLDRGSVKLCKMCVAELYSEQNRQLIIEYQNLVTKEQMVVLFELSKSSLANKNDFSLGFGTQLENVSKLFGGTIAIVCDTGKKLYKASQSIYVAQPSLYQTTLFFGVGTNNSFLRMNMMRLPTYDKEHNMVMVVESNMFPSTWVNCLTLGKGELSTLVFFESPYLDTVFLVILISAIIGLCILAIIIKYENYHRAKLEAEVKSKKMQFFRATLK